MEKIEKTNVMRLLDQKKVDYKSFCYLDSGAISGVEVADFLKIERSKTFKTLVTVGKSGRHYVFDIPVDKELNLRKAAESVGEKNIEMIKSKDLLPLTGYIHGGCSPIGMKKFFTTIFDITAKNYDRIYFSAGKIGYFVEVPIEDLKKLINFNFFPLTD